MSRISSAPFLGRAGCWHDTGRSSSYVIGVDGSLPARQVSLTCDAHLCKYDFMRTTVDLPDPLFRRVKCVAGLRGSTLKGFILGALQQAVTGGVRVRGKVRLPLIRSKHPGALHLTNADIEDHLA